MCSGRQSRLHPDSHLANIPGQALILNQPTTEGDDDTLSTHLYAGVHQLHPHRAHSGYIDANIKQTF